MTVAQSSRWLQSSKRNPCPICGRTKDGDCRIKSDGQEVICHHPKDYRPGEVVNGWAFTGNTEDGRAGHFTVDKPLDTSRPGARKVVPLRPAQPKTKPAPITGPILLARLPEPGLPEPPPEHLPDGHRLDYSPTQWTEIKDHGERPRHLAGGEVLYSAGPDPWPLYGHHLLQHACGKWIAAAEGPKCATWLQAGGLIAVSQPGHDHKSESLTRRFQELQAAGIAGMLYLADHDATGQRKAEQLAAAAAAARVPFIALQAAEVWADLPQGGSIDDAPGSAADRVAALMAALDRKQAERDQDPAAVLDELLGPAEEGKLRRPRTDLLTKALSLLLPLRYNLLANRIEHDGQPIHGDYLGGLYLQLAEDYGLEVAKDRAIDAAIRVARTNAFHPVQDYLNGLTETLSDEDWAALDARCFGGEDPSGWGVIHLQRQLIGLVARALEPGCELHTCLVLQSDQQGIGKSTFWKLLGGEWFSDSLGDLRDVREDRLQLHSAWIHEWGEIDAMIGKRESETLKRFLSCSRDDVRRPYGRGTEQLLRSCGLVGTTNRRDFIKDPTGNRRFPIIQIRKVQLDWVKTNRDRIWGSAVEAYKADQPWHYSAAEGLVVSQQAMGYAAEDPLRDRLETWSEDHPELDNVPLVRVLWDLRDECPDYWERRTNKEFMRQVALAMTALGWAVAGERVRYLLPNRKRTDRVSLWKRPK